MTTTPEQDDAVTLNITPLMSKIKIGRYETILEALIALMEKRQAHGEAVLSCKVEDIPLIAQEAARYAIRGMWGVKPVDVGVDALDLHNRLAVANDYEEIAGVLRDVKTQSIKKLRARFKELA